jgi:hypothetical protein
VSCALCSTRKEKRFCPAVHGKICPQCCGREREVSLDCPSECPYLQQAHREELPRRLAEVEQEALLPQVEVRQQFLYEREPLLVGLSYALAQAGRMDRELRDRDLLAALTALAQRYQTRVRSGLVYEHALAGPGQQALVTGIEKSLAEYRTLEQQHLGAGTLRDSEALEALVFLLRMGHARTTGRPRSRAYLDFLLAQFPEKKGALAAPGEGSKIVMP